MDSSLINNNRLISGLSKLEMKPRFSVKKSNYGENYYFYVNIGAMRIRRLNYIEIVGKMQVVWVC